MAPNKQLTLFITFKIKPDRIEEFKEAQYESRPVWAACAKEPECLFFDVFEDPKIPGKFRFVEIWSKDWAWFEKEQMTKAYYAELWPKSKPTWEEEVQIEVMERVGEGTSYKQAYLDGAHKSG